MGAVNIGASPTKFMSAGDSIVSRLYLGGTLVASPAEGFVSSLFSNGEQGAWYDPSDLSTMFQDASGTTPVYMPGQGQPDCWIGMQLDKRFGLVLGPELVINGDSEAGAAVAPLDSLIRFASKERSSDFKNSGAFSTKLTSTVGSGSHYWQLWLVPAGKSVFVQGSAYVPAGATAGQSLRIVDQEDGSIIIDIVGASDTGRWVPFQFRRAAKATAWVLSIGNNLAADWNGGAIYIDDLSVRELPGNHRWQGTAISRPVLSARYNLLTGTEALATQSVNVAAASYILRFYGAGSVTLSGAAAGTYSAGSHSITCTAGSLTLTVSGGVAQADLRAANDGVDLPPYQRVVDASTYDTAGFPLYRKPDGVDDWMQTSAVDFSGTDKVTIVAAVRKTGTTRGMILELPLASGAFLLQSDEVAGTVQFQSGGSSISAVSVAGQVSPVTRMYQCAGDIANDTATIRVNGVPSGLSSTDQGTGAFGSGVIYFDRRNGSSLPWSGRDYGTIIVGRLLTGPETAAVEKLLRQKSKAY